MVSYLDMGLTRLLIKELDFILFSTSIAWHLDLYCKKVRAFLRPIIQVDLKFIPDFPATFCLRRFVFVRTVRTPFC